jgi:hypothetical protein
MIVFISGNIGQDDAVIKDVPFKDGSGTFRVGEASVAVKVSQDVSNWFRLKFRGDRLLNASQYVAARSPFSGTGRLSFESWETSTHEKKTRPVINLTELQLAPKVKS